MRKTTNKGLMLYDTNDKMSITPDNNSLNNNMVIIDEELSKVYTQINDEVKPSIDDLTTALNIERKRIDNIISLPDGSTTSDAELADARIDKDGITHESVGEHIRTVTTDLTNSLNDRIIEIAKGGTGATTAEQARINLGITPTNVGAAPSEHTHSTDDIVSGILPIMFGGTEADNRIEAFSNLLTIPANTAPTEDTPAEWAKLGSFICLQNSDGNMINKPSTYGILIQIIGSKLYPTDPTYFTQIWIRQAYGYVYTRSGNKTGWNGDANLSGADAWLEGGIKDIGLNNIFGGGLDSDGRITTLSEVGGGRKAISNESGILKIVLPQDFNGAMIKFDIDIYDYSQKSLLKYSVGAQVYKGTTSNSWSKVTCDVVGDYGDFVNLPVSFGRHNGKLAISIGESSTNWGYAQVVVRNVQITNNRYSYTYWQNGWNIILDSNALDEVMVTKTDIGIRPIETGGTGANNAEQALMNLGGMSMKLLWENANPTSSFTAQTISLDLSEYTHLIIKVKLLDAGERAFSFTLVKKDGSKTPLVYANGGNAGVQLRYRNATAVDTGVNFTNAYYASGATAESVNNGVAIPIEIYGIKGVQ